MSRYKPNGPRCEGVTEAHLSTAHRCRNVPVPGMKFCIYHGPRPPRLVVKDGPRRGYAEISCVHLALKVTFDAGESDSWARQVIKQTTPHRCFREIRKRYGLALRHEKGKP